MSRKEINFKTRLSFQILLFLGILIIFGGALIFLGGDIKNTATKINSTKEDLDIKLMQLSDLARLREDVKLANARLPILQDVLPNKDELLSFPNRLNNIAGQNEVDINFEFGNEQENNIDFNLIIEGDYGAISKFIEEIELTMPFINFSNLDLVQIGTSDTYRSTLKGIIFFSE